MFIDTDTSSLNHSVANGEMLSDVLSRPLDQYSTVDVTGKGEIFSDPEDGNVDAGEGGTMTFHAILSRARCFFCDLAR
ncbi:hypothetical protein P0Y35_05025 [Kiritimatiellaeota bacterium B1221]|nr:hypothetical protein [Kiritimatiellaeota bacterium B1221]